MEWTFTASHGSRYGKSSSTRPVDARSTRVILFGGQGETRRHFEDAQQYLLVQSNRQDDERVRAGCRICSADQGSHATPELPARKPARPGPAASECLVTLDLTSECRRSSLVQTRDKGSWSRFCVAVLSADPLGTRTSPVAAQSSPRPLVCRFGSFRYRFSHARFPS